jgi:hypothetical protein
MSEAILTEPLMTVATFEEFLHKAQPTLRHIALIYQDQMRVGHYRKTELTNLHHLAG